MKGLTAGAIRLNIHIYKRLNARTYKTDIKYRDQNQYGCKAVQKCLKLFAGREVY